MSYKYMTKDTTEGKRSDRIIYYYSKGLNNAEIAKLVDCSRENVRQVLQKIGVFSPLAWERNRKGSSPEIAKVQVDL